MCRQSSIQKEKIILKEFQRLLRSGKDLSALSMYQDAGSKCFLEPATAGNIIRKHYRDTISYEMKMFVIDRFDMKFNDLLKEFEVKFKLCKRESRLIIGYIR
ncbi:MAG: hypothetical protein PHT07_23825 [Paludibacter sp.]|nr:hypothetical protein [Paludibacter sp.]